MPKRHRKSGATVPLINRAWYAVVMNIMIAYYPMIFTTQTCTLKGKSHEIFCIRFFHSSAPLGSIRDVLGPFWSIAYFHRVIGLLNYSPVSHAYNSAKKQKNRNGPRTSLMGPWGAVWWKKRIQKSRETVPLIWQRHIKRFSIIKTFRVRLCAVLFLKSLNNTKIVLHICIVGFKLICKNVLFT